jgi:hypothetical protein
MTTTAAGVRMPARNSDGRYAVKWVQPVEAPGDERGGGNRRAAS